ncbi:MAG: M28 family peptidase, partial [Bacteroidota bacterium]
FFIKDIYDEALTNGRAYQWLEHLSTKIGPRLSGTPNAAAAVEYVRQMLDTLGMDTVYLQPCIVPHWDRGEPEQVRIVNSEKIGTIDLKALALGNSIGTGPMGLTADVIEVQSLDEVDELGPSVISGKIVFYNRPLDRTQLNTFRAYGGAVDQRVFGAARAAKNGAIGVLVRSMTTQDDDNPHTGTTVYDPEIEAIPTIAISTNDANLLSRLLTEEVVRVFMRNTSRMLAPKLSYNVVGEIKGTEFPDEILLVGGHLDSWDVGQGAHDDGAGCVHAMDVIHLLKALDYQPKRTLRCVLFMNEENGQAGAIAYRDTSFAKNEFHLAAIESDRGGFTPRGFSCDGHPDIYENKFKKMVPWFNLLAPYGLDFQKGGSGADISRLKDQKGMLFGFSPDTQRYFDYHHTAVDLFETVNERELQMGSAAMTCLIYLIDKYGL